MKTKHKAISPMGLFTLRYLIWAPLLFGLIYFEDFSPLIFINELQTDLNVYLLQEWINFYTIDVRMVDHDLFFTHGLHLTVVNECNVMAAFLLFTAAVLSYPTSGSYKIPYLLFGYTFLVIANLVRLAGITYYVIDHPRSFALLHEVIGRYVIAGIPLILFYFFTVHSPLQQKKS